MSTEFNSVITTFVPAAYYRLTSGAETTDTSAGGHTLTAIGVPVQGTPKWSTGCAGLGTSQAFSAVDGADFRPTGNFSIMAWIRTNKTATTQLIFQSWSFTTYRAGLYLRVGTGNKIRFASAKDDGTNGEIDSTSTVCDGAWHQIVGTYDGAKLHIYVDGSEEGTGAAWTSAPVFEATSYVRVGCENGSGTNATFFQGELDEVAFFNGTALSAAQVTTLFTNELNTQAAILALATAYYRFEDGALLTDTTANAHTLTAIGTPTNVTTKFAGNTFLGNSSAYSAVDHADFQPSTAFTIGAWERTLTTGTTKMIFSSYSANTNIAGFYLNIGTSNSLVLRSGKNSGTVLNTDYKVVTGNSTTLCDGSWHQVIGTWDGTNLKVYVDGLLDATAVAWANAPVFAATNYVRIGGQSDSGALLSPFTGCLDDVFLLNGRALSSTDISNLYGTYPTTASTNYLKQYRRTRFPGSITGI